MTWIFALFVFIAVYFALAWWLRPLSRLAVDQTRVDREMWQELDRLRDRAARVQRVESVAGAEGAEASRAGLAVESLGDEAAPAPRQLGRAHIRVVKPPRSSFMPWDGKTH